MAGHLGMAELSTALLIGTAAITLRLCCVTGFSINVHELAHKAALARRYGPVNTFGVTRREGRSRDLRQSVVRSVLGGRRGDGWPLSPSLGPLLSPMNCRPSSFDAS